MAPHTPRLRRTTDRVEDWAAWLLLATGMMLTLISCVIGVRTHDQLIERGRAEASERTPGVATLIDAAPTIPSGYAGGSPVMVAATWQDRSGVPHTGLVSVPQGLVAGHTVPIWTDGSGSVAPAPTSADDALLSGIVAAGLVLGAGATLLVCVWALVRRVTLACNCARWEREWRAVAPVWIQGEDRRG
jgi:hypothetical protein